MATNNVTLKAIKSVDGEVTCVSFHPSKDILSYGTIEGNLKLGSYSTESDFHELMSFKHHKKSCRAVSYYEDGSHIMSASADKSFALIDLKVGSLVHRFKKAHECAIYSALVVNRHIVATGDDNGKIKLWDTRHHKSIMEMSEHDDCITDMITDEKNNLLLCTSGDGTLSVHDIRKHKLKMQSELMNSGLQSLAIVKNGEKLVCGSEDGVLNFFNWNEWGNISDRFPGHPMSIEKIVPLTPQLICTAASDAIRAVSVFPNRIIDIIGDHGGSPVESLSLSHCRTWLASCSHDQHVRFWDVSNVNSNGKAKKNVRQFNTKGKNKFSTKSEISKRENFFADLVEDIKESSGKSDPNKNEIKDEETDSDDDDDDGESDDGNSCSSDGDDIDDGSKKSCKFTDTNVNNDDDSNKQIDSSKANKNHTCQKRSHDQEKSDSDDSSDDILGNDNCKLNHTKKKCKKS
ncbi:hypothetical protein HELRODRAFT_111197 [Helobdella robusta]|uniref:Uncharacterized protein n=1 Tax=Helobdella robusta TaxID=6412 RepID=T1EF95_HELRO|nr:hypothetical protein HELRODRAFT_111197 [Helobdella robusta]ESO05194.1 hypothetical protein HELRODRAFT_111197 [Helobdella robusta]